MNLVLPASNACQLAFDFQWKQDNPVPEHLISFVDDNVLNMLPDGTRVVSITPSGKLYWARTAKIVTLDSSDREISYFLKVHIGDHGFKMVQAEHQAMTTLHVVAPDMTPEPVGSGTYKSPLTTADSQRAAHFLLSRFHNLSGEVPIVANFPRMLSEMHKRSMTLDSATAALLHGNGGHNDTHYRFGSHFTTYGGNRPTHFPPSETWELCFSEPLRHTFALEAATHGDSDGKMAGFRDAILGSVVPRLLRPLETSGRGIEPVLVHGDMWDGNASVDVDTGMPVIFDGTPLWAHNEYELVPMVPARHKMNSQYINEHVRHFPISEPEEDFQGRLELYCLRFDLHASSLYSGETQFREIAKVSMRSLLAKYAVNDAAKW